MKLFFLLFFSLTLNAASPKKISDSQKIEILKRNFSHNPQNGNSARIKAMALNLGGKAVPVLIEVMKNAKYADQHRWQATFLLGQIMGRKASPFISKFSNHPLWVMRVASLKALLALREKQYAPIYHKALKDPSLIVRVQALDNISQLKLTHLSPAVWGMMYDQTNYVGEIGKRKRTSIVKSIIRTLGDLEYQKAKKPLASLLQKQKYADLTDDIDYSLLKMTGLNSSGSNAHEKKIFWKKELASLN